MSGTADQLSRFLTTQPGVTRVYYPGRTEHPSHVQALQFLANGCGGMLSFELRGGKPAVAALFRSLADIIPFSPTLADARTTLSYPAGTSHKFMTAAERLEYGIGDGLVRLSVGLEAPADLERELSAALATLSGV